MQLKTIKRVISAKLEDWLGSITDLDLKRDLKKNILVSGGSITSLLLNEKVNDYDVYIKDRAVLLRLVKYYTEPHANIKILDGVEKEQLISDHMAQKIDNPALIKDDGYWVSLRTLKPEQIKLFFGGAGFRVEKTENPYSPVYFSPNAISLTDDIQIVIRFWGDSKAIHETFDFVHATNYFTFEEGLVTNKAALESILTKYLKYQGSQYPLTSIIRTKKFIKRGWNITAGEYLKIMYQISQLNLNDFEVLEEQLIGVDVAYFAQLITILREVSPDKLDHGYISTIIDRISYEYDTEEI